MKEKITPTLAPVENRASVLSECLEGLQLGGSRGEGSTGLSFFSRGFPARGRGVIAGLRPGYVRRLFFFFFLFFFFGFAEAQKLTIQFRAGK